MSRVGEILKKRREIESKSLEDVATQTMISKKYILGLEEGNYEIFPGKIYAKGFLRNYANFLGFDEDEIKGLVSQYEVEWQETHFDMDIPAKSKLRKTFSALKTNRLFYTITFILIIICITGFLTIYVIKQKKLFQQERTIHPDLTNILEEKDISNAEEIIKKKIEEIKKAKEEEIEEQSVVIKPEEVLLEGFAFEKVWLKAIIDGKRQKEILLEEDKKIKLESKKEIFLTIGNAGGIVFKLNDRYIGALGRKGEVKKVLVTSAGIEVIKTHEKKEEILPFTSSKEEVSTSSFPHLQPITSTLTIKKQETSQTTE